MSRDVNKLPTLNTKNSQVSDLLPNHCSFLPIVQIDGNDEILSDEEGLQGRNYQINVDNLLEIDYDVKKLDTDMFSMPQIDGMDNLIEEESINQAKTVFATNCERNELVQLINFLRSLNNMWLLSAGHRLCKVDDDCFYCHSRSSFLRLRTERQKGPFALKLNEFVCQIGKYKSDLDFNLMSNLSNVKECIDKTLQLLFRYQNFSSFYTAENERCCFCSLEIETFFMNFEVCNSGIQIFDLKHLLNWFGRS